MSHLMYAKGGLANDVNTDQYRGDIKHPRNVNNLTKLSRCLRGIVLDDYHVNIGIMQYACTPYLYLQAFSLTLMKNDVFIVNMD